IVVVVPPPALNAIGKPSEPLAQDHASDYDNEHRGENGHEDLQAQQPEGAPPVGGAPREPDRDERNGQGDDVDEDMEGFGQQREAVRHDRGDGFDDEGDPGEPERDEEPTPLTRSGGRCGEHDSQRYNPYARGTRPSTPVRLE